MSGIPRESVSAYADDITITVTEMDSLPKASKAIEEYEMLAGANVNREKSVGLLLSNWRSNLMPSDNVVRHLTEGLIKLLGSGLV